MKKYAWGFSLMSLIPSTWGVIHHPIVSQEKSSFCIANKDFTRIAVKDDRIKSAFGILDHIHVEKDNDAGQIFVRALTPDEKGPFNLSLTTEKGVVYDLSLTFSNKPTEAILLVIKDDKKEAPSAAEKGQEDVFIRLIGERLKDIIKYVGGQKDHMFVYEEKPALIGQKRLLPFDLSCTLEAAWEKGRYRSLLYRVTNEGTSPAVIEERLFQRPGDKALYLNQKRLLEGEKGWLFVIQAREINHD